MTRRTSLFSLRGALLASALVTISEAASAREEPVASSVAASPATATEDDIVVTAARRATDLQKTALTISAFDPKTLADRNIANIRDLAGQIPNLFVARTSISHTTQTFSGWGSRTRSRSPCSPSMSTTSTSRARSAR
jgi:iron complex outermembrane receptor protein